MEKNFSTIQNFIMNSEDLTLKQMFDISAKLVSDQDEINGDETVINLQCTKVYVFSDSVLCLGRVLQHRESNEAWNNRIAVVKSVKSHRDYDGIDGESTEFEWNIFPGFTTLQLCGKINDLLSDLVQTPETFTGRIFFVSMFNNISCGRKGNKEECLENARVVIVFARKFGVGQWSFIGPGSEKEVVFRKRTAHKELRMTSRTKCGWNSKKADIPLSVQRLYCPEVFSRTKDMENCRYTSLQMFFQLTQLFALSFLSIRSVSTEQWQLFLKNLRTINTERVDLMH